MACREPAPMRARPLSRCCVGMLTNWIKSVDVSHLPYRAGSDIHMAAHLGHASYTTRGKSVHELAVTESLLHLAVLHAQQASATRVTALQLVIGQLSSIVDDSVQFYWDMISAGTLCEGARLQF